MPPRKSPPSEPEAKPNNFNEFLEAKKRKPRAVPKQSFRAGVLAGAGLTEAEHPPEPVEKYLPATPRAKPATTDSLDTTIEDVRRTVQSACLTLLRWEGHAKFRDVRGNTLRSFSEGMAEAALEVAQLAEGEEAEEHGGHGLKIPPAEISLALMSAALIILYRYEVLQPEQAKAFLGQLARGV